MMPNANEFRCSDWRWIAAESVNFMYRPGGAAGTYSGLMTGWR
jgi:hypothetical protein